MLVGSEVEVGPEVDVGSEVEVLVGSEVVPVSVEVGSEEGSPVLVGSEDPVEVSLLLGPLLEAPLELEEELLEGMELPGPNVILKSQAASKPTRAKARRMECFFMSFPPGGQYSTC